LTTKKLQQLKDAYESGLLTDEEFATKKKQVLDAAMIEDVPERGPLPQTTTPSPTPSPSPTPAPTETPNTSQNVDDQSNHPPKKPQDGSKFIPIILILLFSLFVASGFLKEKKSAPPVGNDAVEADNGNTRPESQQYVTASALSLRTTPNKGATRTNVLPSGTRILVKQTESQLVVGGQIGHWYRAVELDGYVAGHFIAPDMGAEGSPYVLARNDDTPEYGRLERLILHAGKAKHLLATHGGAGRVMSERNGRYHVLPDGIKITLDPGKEWDLLYLRNSNNCWPTSNHLPSSCKTGVPTPNPGLVINLRYCHELGGFSTGSCDPPDADYQVHRDKIGGIESCHWVYHNPEMGSNYQGWWCPPKTNK
jgi:hypothetical protein